MLLIGLTAPHLTTQYLERPHESPVQLWMQFVGVILALSGVEAIANLTGVMKLDRIRPRPSESRARTARAIWPVAVEVVFGTALLGWAMLSLNPDATSSVQRPHSMREALRLRSEDMLRFIGEQFATLNFGPRFRSNLRLDCRHSLLLPPGECGQHRHRRNDRSALHDGPRSRDAGTFTRLNRHGVPLGRS